MNKESKQKVKIIKKRAVNTTGVRLDFITFRSFWSKYIAHVNCNIPSIQYASSIDYSD